MTRENKSKKESVVKTKDEELESILKTHRTKIKVIGAGGAGNNTISRLTEVGIKGVETVAINTDAQDLLFTKSDHKILIGKNISNGLGAGSNPQIGENSARENEEEIRELLDGCDMVFITCGLGGGTGTGSAPVIAEIARSLHALTISVITLPFTEEGILRQENANVGLDRLRENSDTVIVVQNDRLLDMVPDLPLNAAFKVADEILTNAVKGITELVTEKGLVNLDFADVKSIMKDGDTAMIGIGESDSENKAQDAVLKAIDNPLLDVDITGAQSALINITGNESMSIREARSVMTSIAEKLDPKAKIIWGARIDEELEGKLRVLLIATGTKAKSPKRNFSESEPKPQKPEKKKDDADPVFDIKESATFTSKIGEETISKSLSEASPKTETVEVDEDNHHDGDQKEEKEEQQQNAPRVFDQMFEEEIEGDLNILKDSLNQIDMSNLDQKIFRNIKNACIALQNSAQLYSHEKIEEFTMFIGGLFEEIMAEKVSVSEEFLPHFQNIPAILEGMLVNDDNALSDAQYIIEQLTKLIDQQSNGTNKKNKLNLKNLFHHGSSDSMKDELKIEQEDLKTKLRMDLN